MPFINVSFLYLISLRMSHVRSSLGEMDVNRKH